MIRRPPGPPDAAAPESYYRMRDADRIASADRTFVRRSLRPVPRSRFEALTARAGDVFLVLCALVVLLGFLSRC